MDAVSDKPAALPPVRADVNSQLSLVRTRLSQDRTLLSWVRTAVSLITFGFGVHQFFRLAPSVKPHGLHETTPYVFGSAMVAIGLLALVLAAVEDRTAAAALDAAFPASSGFPARPRSHARLLATVIGLLGIGALILMNVAL